MASTRRRRFHHPEAEPVWAAIEVLDVGLQHQLLRELDAFFKSAGENPTTHRGKAAAALAALHRAAEALGHPPSIPEYRDLRMDRAELKLPDDRNIRRWLADGNAKGDGWNECLRRAGLDVISDGDFTSPLIGRTYRFDDAEVFAALRDSARELGQAPTMSMYLQWAKSPEVSARPGRRPISYHPFDRFGGLRNALFLAGVIRANETRYASNGRLLPLRYAYSEQDMKEALVAVAEAVGHSPRVREYERERQKLYKATLSNNKLRPMPTAAVIRDHFGSWNEALEFAGLSPVESHLPSFTGGHRPRYTEPQVIEWLRKAWVDLGEPFTGTAYAKWRRGQLAAGEAEIPSLACVAHTFGGWNKACQRALPEEYRTGFGRVLRR